VSYTILYVDSDAERAERLRGPLEEEGYRLVSVQGAIGAIASLQEDRPDLIVVDAGLSDGSVSELCQALREADGGAQVALVVIGGGDDAEQDTIAELAQSGADLLVEKPITAERLFGLCKDLLGSDDAVDAETGGGEPAPETEEDDELTKPVSSSVGDGLLDPESVQSAMGRLESIMDTSDDDDNHAGERARAAARGDFSELLDEVNVDHPPTHTAGVDYPSGTAAELGSTTEAESGGGPEPIEIVQESGLELVEEAAREPNPTMPSALDAPGPADEGQDIEDHLDTLFAGGGASLDQGVTPSPVPLATVEAPEEPLRSAPLPAPSDPPDDSPAAAESPAPPSRLSPEPRVAEPAASPRRDDTAPFSTPQALPGARDLFDPPDSPPTASAARERDSRAWLYAALAAFVVVGVVAVWFLGGLANDSPATDGAATPSAGSDAPRASTSVPPTPIGPTTVEGAAESRRDSSGDPAATKPRTAASTPAGTTAASESANTTARPTETTPAAEPRAAATTPAGSAATTTPSGNTKPRPTETTPAAESRAAATTPADSATTTTPSASSKPQPTETIPAAEPRAATAAASTVATTDPIETAVTAPGDTAEPTPTESVTEGRALEPAQVEKSAEFADVADSSPAAEPEPIQPVPDVRVPVVLTRVEPEVTAKTMKKGGTVVLKVLVNERGGISRVLVERGIPGSDAEAASINAVLRWSFQPATRQGKPIRAWTKVSFEFGK